MNVSLAPPRKTALLLLPALLLIWPALGPMAQPAAASTNSQSLFYDPGPSHSCWGRLVESPPDGDTSVVASQTNLSGCGDFSATNEFTRDNPAGATWDLGTWGWNNSSWGQSTGPTFTAQPGSHSVTMNDNAPADCTLHETNVSYTYQDAQLRPKVNRQFFTLADGQVNVSYNATVHKTNSGWGCSENRAILTTDFIFYDTNGGIDHPDVISIVHYDPSSSGFLPKDGNGAYWSTHCDGTHGDCRVTVPGNTMLQDSQQGAVNDDVNALFDRWSAYLNPKGLPKSAFKFKGVQIVSSNKGSSTTSTVSNIDARITPYASVHSAITNATPTGSLCLDDTGGVPTSPAVPELWTCNGNSAQDWTLNQDNTVTVQPKAATTSDPPLCLDNSTGSSGDHNPVVLYTCNGGPNQKWVLGRWGEMYNPATGKCLQPTSGVSGAGLEIFSCWGGTNQKWYAGEPDPFYH
ncbi:RICIN domain-containing protein [Streptomyces sp. NPDC047028]|uniref:RICIN domain-containing protein n=1 Tax=Streptomyces sp. NPDC047028 TaxID=3155793 RepID=UPI0033ED077C